MTTHPYSPFPPPPVLCFFFERSQKYVANAVGHGEQHALRQRHHRQVCAGVCGRVVAFRWTFGRLCVGGGFEDNEATTK